MWSPLLRFYKKKSYESITYPSIECGSYMGGTRLQFLKINMIHVLSKPSYGDMMNSFEYQQESQLSLTKNEHPPNTHAKTSKEI